MNRRRTRSATLLAAAFLVATCAGAQATDSGAALAPPEPAASVAEALARLDQLLPPLFPLEASVAELMRDLPGNPLNGAWDPRWQKLRLAGHAVERTQEAKAEAEALIERLTRTGGAHDWKADEARLRLAELLWARGEVVDSGRLTATVLSRERERGDEAGSLLGAALVARARWLHRVGDFESALALLEEARASSERLPAEESTQLTYVLEEIGASQFERGDFVGAEASLARADEGRRLVVREPGERLSLLKRLAVARLAIEIERREASAEAEANEEGDETKKKRRAKPNKKRLAAPAAIPATPLEAALKEIVEITGEDKEDVALAGMDRAWALTMLATLFGEPYQAASRAAGEANAKYFPRSPMSGVALAGAVLLPSREPAHASMLRRAEHFGSWSVEQYVAAQEIYAVVIAEHAAAASRPSALAEAEMQRRGAQSLLRAGELGRSGEMLKAASALTNAELGPDHLESVVARTELAHQQWHSSGALTEIAATLEQAVDTLQDELGTTAVPVGLALGDLAMLRAEMGEYAEAFELAIRARSILSVQLAAQSAILARAAPTIAWALRESGAIAEMEATLLDAPPDRSISICTHLHLNRDLMLADLRLRQGKLAEAKELVRVEVSRCGRTGRLLENLAPLQEILAPGYKARAKPRDAENLNEFAHQGRRWKKGLLWGGLILVGSALAVVGMAAAAYGSIMAGATGGAAAGSGLLIPFLAVTTGGAGASAGMLVKDLTFEQAPIVDPLREAAFYEVVGEVLREGGLYREASGLQRGAIEGMEADAGKDHPKIAGMYRSLAEIAWDSVEPSGKLRDNDEKEALHSARKSASLLDQFLHEAIATLPEQQALRLVASRAHPEEILFSGLLYGRTRAEAWQEAAWDWALQRRSLVLDELAFRHQQALDARSPEVARAWDEFVASRRRLAGLWVRGPQTGYTQWPELDAAVKAREEAERALARVSESFRESEGERASGVADVARALPRRSALVEYVRVAVRRPGQRERNERYVALILDATGKSTFADLGPSQEIDPLVAAWIDALRRSYESVTDPSETVPSTPEASGQLLRQKIWDPVARKLESVDLLFVVLDGALHQVQFSALPAAQGGFLVEGKTDIHVLSTGRDLLRLREQSASTGQGMLALGDPDFEAASFDLATSEIAAAPTPASERGPLGRCSVLGGLHWSPLPESRREVEQIASLYSAQGSVETLVGTAASEERLKREASGKRFLHLATHGFFLDEACAPAGESARGIGRVVVAAEPQAGEPRRDPSDAVTLAVAGNPLLRSGLVLAGANRASEAGSARDDGIVTAEELVSLDLRGVQIAALSACDTGLGTVTAGEGVFGLRRALEIAGARTILMSLWSVPDEAARKWMTAFYERVLAGEPVHESARAASLANLAALRAEGRPTHPYLWAGFVAAGDWR